MRELGKSKIEWCDRVWNPVTGCTKVSPGCDHCYAERMSKRFGEKWGLPADDPFRVTKRADAVFMQPLHWEKPSKIFVCSMGDLFHEDVQERWIDGVFGVMGLNYDAENVITAYKQRHTYMILTKRPVRMQQYIQKLVKSDWETLRKRFYNFSMTACDFYYKGQYMNHMNASMTVATWIKDGMPGLWLGVTAENQEQADKRIPLLLQIPAEKRFVSVEPMLGPVDLTEIKVPEEQDQMHLSFCPSKFNSLTTQYDDIHYHQPPAALDWVICGGESGPGSRPVHPDWVRNLRDQCQAADVPKQWGEYCAPSQMSETAYQAWDCYHGTEIWDRDDSRHWRIGKKKAGRLLDGQLWDQYPGDRL